MDFGVFNLLQQRERSKTSAQVIDDALAMVRRAEQLGFSRVWFAEHHFSNYSLCPSPLVMCAYAASVTRRIRLGTAVVVPPLYAPARLLAEIAMVDTLSGGRLDLGVGTGYQRYEFDRFGVDIAQNKAMLLEMLDMIEQGLTQPHFSHRGEFWQLPQTAINVRPVQRPYPPIWMTSKDATCLRRAAERGYTPFISSRFPSAEELTPVRTHIDGIFRDGGVDPQSMPLGLLSPLCVSDDPRQIEHYLQCVLYMQRISNALLERREVVVDDYWVEEVPFAGEPGLEEAARLVLAGNVEQVTDKLVRLLRQVRPSHMALNFQAGDVPIEQSLESMRLFAEQVLPGVEAAFGMPMAEINRPIPPSRMRAAG